MKNQILIISLIILISCKKEIPLQNNRELTLADLKFTTEKIVIEEIPELLGKQKFHFVIKVENKSDKQLKIPINGIQFKEKSRTNQSFFSIETEKGYFSAFSNLFKSATDTINIKPNKVHYVLLSLKENINVDSIKSEMPYFKYRLNQESFKTFKIQDGNTLRIIVKHRLNIEEAVKLVHGNFT